MISFIIMPTPQHWAFVTIPVNTWTPRSPLTTRLTPGDRLRQLLYWRLFQFVLRATAQAASHSLKGCRHQTFIIWLGSRHCITVLCPINISARYTMLKCRKTPHGHKLLLHASTTVEGRDRIPEQQQGAHIRTVRGGLRTSHNPARALKIKLHKYLHARLQQL